ncbi:type I polyketide synthase [Labedaea rhizosphaerae]|uniref:Acyl transferase domain-containing protein n=1 Tax=Labedaea rhizosphaerae TaxID=598644 RepID=A0A4R6SHN8_LABRH|nr:type I polyketide synthase [Labedaea rhizosphaerae]TDQ00458.1 acyl transferase domain-containing protein [Labedaea rhizosphaerae]
MANEDQLRDYLKRATVDLAETRQRLAEVTAARHEPIAVVGMSTRYPGGADTTDAFWDLLVTGRDPVAEVPPERWNAEDYYNPDRRSVGTTYTKQGAFLTGDIAGWDAELFGLSPLEALRTDPQQRLLMELVWEAFEDAGTPPSRLAGSRTGVMVGLMDSGQYGRLEIERMGNGVFADPYFGQGVATNVAAGRLAYHFDLRGPAMTVDTACSSSLVGVHLAVESLRSGGCDLAVAAGVYLIIQPDTFVQTCATSMLAPDNRCKTFDQSADGYVLGEGGGVVVLERLSSALRNRRRIHAVLRGSAVNQDGRSNGLTAPNRSAQVDVITSALADAGVRPEDVAYVEAHGSGTRLGDAIELAALHDVFGRRPADRPVHIGAIKSAIGHTQSAAGMAGLVKTIMVLQHGEVPANRNYAEPADAIPGDGTVRPVTDPVRLSTEDDQPVVAGVSSFGWSGTNAHVVLETAPRPQPAAGHEGPYVLGVSAASAPALKARVTALTEWLEAHPEADLADVEHTLLTGRPDMAVRHAVTCTDRADALAQLAASAEHVTPVTAKRRPRVAFLLPGTGDQYRGLGRELYRSEPVYAAAIDECVALAEQSCGVDLRPLLFPAPDDADRPADDLATLLGRGDGTGKANPDELDDAVLAHPFLFTVEYALAKLFAHWGVRPDLLVGYSLGEYVAACVAGVFSLADALYVIGERARLIAAAPAGQMLAAAADATRVRAALSDVDGVEVAALNGPAMTVLSGAAEPVAAAAARLTADGIANRPLRSAHAFHSSLLAPARDELTAVLDKVDKHAPTTTIVSNSTGTTLTADEATSSAYWAEHLVRPVRFADGVRHCVEQGVDVFVELGAGQTLGGLVRQNLDAAAAVGVFGTLPSAWTGMRGASDADVPTALAAVRARLWERGVAVDWTAGRDGAQLLSLPTYPFQRTRFWPDATQQTPLVIPGSLAAQQLGQPQDRYYVPSWRRDTVRPGGAEPFTGPLVVFADQDGIGTALADLAEASGIPVLEVVPGTELRRDGRRVVIDPAVPAHYQEVFAGLTADDEAPVHVAYLWGLRAAQETPVYATDAELTSAIEHGYDHLLHTVQALGERLTRKPVRLLTVSRSAVEVLGGDALAPQQSVVHGLGRTVRREYAAVDWRGADIDEQQPAALAEALRYELQRPEQDGLAAWRRGRRWSQEWVEPEPSTTDEQSPWRTDGVYLITGGTRGLGMTLAKHLARAGVRKLALVGRSPILRDRVPEPDSPAAHTLTDVAELEAAGVEVLLLAADAGKPDQLRAALHDCRAHFGALHGIVHAAGLPSSGMVQRQTAAGTRAVLAPKIAAMGPLAELFGPDTPAEQRPELLVLYSSAVTAFGGIGEGDYCAANTVLDSYGAALAAAGTSTVVTVAWGPWLHDAWQSALSGSASELAERAGAYRRKYGFTDNGGCALLDRAVRRGDGNVLALRQSIADSLREWSALGDLDSLVEASVVAPAGERFPRPRLRTEFVAPRNDTERAIAEVWQAYLGIEQVGVNDPFFDLGGNSLVGMAMVLAVEKQLDTTIAPAVLFEHPTVAQFAAAVRPAAGTGASTPQDVVAISSARGQRRRRARANRGNEG